MNAQKLPILVLLLVSLFLSACMPTSSNMPSGDWSGSVSAGNGISYPVEITFNECALGEVCARVNYLTLDCESTLTYVNARDGLPVFEETITYGNYCKSGRTVKMTYVDAKTPMSLQWFEKNGDEGPAAALNSGRVVEPTAAPISIPGFGHEVASYQNNGWFINWRAELLDGSLWIPDSHSGNLIRVDARTNQIIATIKVGDPKLPRTDGYDPNAVAFTDGAVWVTQRATNSIAKIDPATNTLVESIKLPNIPYALAADGDTLWISSFEGNVVMRLDLDTRKITSIYVANPLGITVGGGAVWTVGHRVGDLVRIDPATNEVTAKIDLSLPPPEPGAQPEEVIFAEGSVWVANNGGGTVSRVDSITNEIIATIRFKKGHRPFRLGLGGGFIWVTLREQIGSDVGDAIAQIDPATNTIAKLTPFKYANFLIYDNGVLWVGDYLADLNKRAGDRIFVIELEP